MTGLNRAPPELKKRHMTQVLDLILTEDNPHVLRRLSKLAA